MGLIRSALTSLFVVLPLSISATCHASIDLSRQIEVDLANPTDATAKVTWAPADKIAITQDGLGWDGPGNSSRSGWVQTKPIALGLSWRPTTAVYARVTVQPMPQQYDLGNGQVATADTGEVYMRYSVDLKHWSNWQVLQRSEPQSFDENKSPGRHFASTLRVPYRDREEYDKLIREYARMDVPWKSDEEAAIQWILQRDSQFLAQHIPFMGYVQFLFECQFQGGQRVRSLKLDLSYGMGGIHSPPKDESVYQMRDVPWRYHEGTEKPDLLVEKPRMPATQPTKP